MKKQNTTAAAVKQNCNPNSLTGSGRTPKQYRINQIRLNAENFLKFRDTDKVKSIVAMGNLKSYLKECSTFGDTGLSYLAGINSSSKIEKAEKLNTNTLVLYLLPASLSGQNVCANASEGCKAACLNTSGRVKMDTKNIIQRSRLIKTVLFYSNRALFMDKLNREIAAGKKGADKKEFDFSVRLNGTSDLSPELFKIGNKNILELYPEIKFYDYTKQLNRVTRLIKYSNYYITFSYSETNQNEIKQVLKTALNIAVPFLVKKGQDLPKTYLGRTVIDADLTDLRYLDPKRIIAGLRVKEIKNKTKMEQAIKSGFIVAV